MTLEKEGRTDSFLAIVARLGALLEGGRAKRYAGVLLTGNAIFGGGGSINYENDIRSN